MSDDRSSALDIAGRRAVIERLARAAEPDLVGNAGVLE